MGVEPDRRIRVEAERQFARVFDHLGGVRAYAARRGSADPDGIAAETMAIAWRRLGSIPHDDPAPWLYTTARNLLMAEARRAARRAVAEPTPPPVSPGLAIVGMAPELELALRSLSGRDREALLLIAWEELTPTQAAEALGINPIAFRARLMRARRRFKTALSAASTTPDATSEVGTL